MVFHQLVKSCCVMDLAYVNTMQTWQVVHMTGSTVMLPGIMDDLKDEDLEPYDEDDEVDNVLKKDLSSEVFQTLSRAQ